MAGELAPGGVPNPQQARMQLSAIHNQAANKMGEVDASVQAFVAGRRSQVDMLTRTLTDQNAKLKADFDAGAKKRRADFQNSQDSVRKDALARLSELAKDVVPSVDTRLDASKLCPAHQVRQLAELGLYQLPAGNPGDPQSLPVVLPFTNQGHILISGSNKSANVQNMLRNLIAQAYLAAPAGQLLVTVFDPKMTNLFADFYPSNNDSSIFHSLSPNKAALEQTLKQFLDHIMAVNSSMAGGYASMGDLVEKTNQHEHPYRLLVILDAPHEWSEQATQDLQRILDKGSSTGISVILQRDPDYTDEFQDQQEIRNALDNMLAKFPVLEAGGRDFRLHVKSSVRPFTPLPAPNRDAIRQLVSLLVDAAREGALPKVDFETMVNRSPASSQSGMDLLLGKSGPNTVGFTLGDSISNLHNILIGGAVGTGKTNLLKVLIYSLASRYNADELEMFLLDFKEGVEFQQFGQTDDHPALPNARLISVESDTAFGIATLRYFADELEKRSKLFKEAGVNNIANYRAKTGEKMPRWLLVADEFQVLFEGDSNEEATELLETVVRKGRAYGLHVVLASQTLTGIRFYGGKGDAIFAQFPVRIVLNMPKQESEIFLGTGNSAAARLRYRGQAVLNTHHGLEEDNQIFVVAYADDQYLVKLQTELASQGPKANTRLYQGDRSTSAREILRSCPAPIETIDGIPFWFGQHCSVDAAVAKGYFERIIGSHLLVLGSDIAGGLATLQLASLSATAASNEKPRVLFFDALIPRQAQYASKDRWVATLQGLGAEVINYSIDQVNDFLDELSAADGSCETLAILCGAENSDLKQEADLYDWQNLITVLPRKGVHILGHWSDSRMVPGNEFQIVQDYYHQVFVNATQQAIASTTNLPSMVIPSPAPGKAHYFSALSPKAGIIPVTSVAPMTEADFGAWLKL